MRIVGLDLGASAVKIVEIDSAFGRYEIHDHREIPVQPGEDPVVLAGLALQSMPQPPQKLVVALRSSKLTTRNLQLPTRDRKAIRSAVAFELEDELPFSIDDAVMDSAILAQVGQVSQVHVATTLKKVFAPELVRLQQAGIDPDIITTDAWALRTLVNRVLKTDEQEKPVMVAHIGEQSTLFYIHWRGFPMLGREIQWGGRDITEELARTLGVDFAQAEAYKCNPTLIQDSHPDGVIPLVGNALESIRRELRHMDLVCKGICHEPIQKVLISGGGSLIAGLPEWLEAQTRLPAQRLRSLSSLSPSGVNYATTADLKMSLAAGLAMSLVGNDRNLVVNFRKGDFSKNDRGLEINFQNLKAPLIAAGVTASIFFASMAVQSGVYGRRLEDRDAQLKKAMGGFFGTVSQSALRTYLSSPGTLKNSLQKELEKNRELAKAFGPNPNSPLLFLKSLSESVPKDIVVDVMNFQLGSAPDSGFDPKKDSSFTLTIISQDPKAAERISSIIVPKLLESGKPSTEELPAAVGKPKRYKTTWTGKATARTSQEGAS